MKSVGWGPKGGRAKCPSWGKLRAPSTEKGNKSVGLKPPRLTCGHFKRIA